MGYLVLVKIDEQKLNAVLIFIPNSSYKASAAAFKLLSMRMLILLVVVLAMIKFLP